MPARPQVQQAALEPVLEVYRARRAWVRYWINFHIADHHGVFYKTVKTTVNTICPTWDGATESWLEPSPFVAPAGFFPSDYTDRLLTGVRWRVMGLRTIRPNGKKRLVRVWDMEWPRTLAPNAGWLKRAGLESEEARADFRRLWDVINGLDRLHRELLATALTIRTCAADSDRALANTLNDISIPLPPR